MALLAYGHTALVEPNLLIPGKKPIGPVKIDETHSLARGLVAAKLLRGPEPTGIITGASEFKPLAGKGMSWYTGVDSNIAYSDIKMDDSADYTVVWSEYVNSGFAVGNRGPLKIERTNDVSPWYVFYGGTSSSYNDLTIRTSQGRVQFNAGVDTPDEEYRIVAIARKGTTGGDYLGFTCAINGVAQTVESGAALSSASGNVTWIGKGYDDHRGYIGLFYLYDRGLSRTELREITTDPYQIYRAAG